MTGALFMCPVCKALSQEQCTVCGTVHLPRPGDIYVCAQCGEPAMTESDERGGLALRELTEDEWCELPGECLQDLARAKKMIRVVHGFRRAQERLL